MIYVGAFAISELGPELMVIESIHRTPRDIVRLCRLSDGHRFSLNPSRFHVLNDGWKAFEKHMHEEVKKRGAALTKASTVSTKSVDDTESVIAQYFNMIDDSASAYRLLPLITYIIHKEYERSYYQFYTVADCWKHVIHVCDVIGATPPSLKVVRARLGVFSRQHKQILKSQSSR